MPTLANRRSPKPVGFVVIAVSVPNGTATEEHVFPGSRAEVMEQITRAALELLLAEVQGATAAGAQ